MHQLRFLYLLLCLICGIQAVAQNDKNFYSLQDQWKVYDKNSSSFLPYLEDQNPFAKNFYLLLNKDELFGLGIEFVLPEGSAVFINNQLQKVADIENKTIYFSNHLLLEKVGKEKDILLVVNTVTGRMPEAYLTNFQYSYRTLTSDKIKNYEEGIILPRFNSQYRSMLLMWSVIVFILVSICAKIGGLKTGFESIMKAFEGVTLGRSDINKLNTLQLLMFLMCFILVGSLAMMLFGSGDIWLSKVNSAETNKTYADFFNNITYIIISIFLFVVFRLIIIYVLGNIFGNKQVSSIHSIEFYKMTWVYVLFYLFLCVLWTLNPLYLSWDFMRYFIGIAFFLKSFLVYIAVYKQVNLRFNYLFSYFCATEFLPSLLAVKVFIG
ncbi:DUF4271 domain-containing protein [Flammeovirga pacifica]|uniref:DUF4271 domain-containing protein n=1 Tax=Flammeovirga pacifica TaxID=915059 RepID=A0A1S1Z2F0_FLAPC|nr:DUF4271 domain-containing protein [Flammeovirga pacifica]OHX67407.1 hypothetical protein NH26_14180 [Flammeovirga pacifica]